MKKNAMLNQVFLVCTFTIATAAECLSQNNYLIGPDTPIRFYFGTHSELLGVGTESGFQQGASAGVVFDNRLYVGAFGMGLVTIHNRNIFDANGNVAQAYLSSGEFGMIFKYSLFPHAIIHPTFSSRIGVFSAAWTVRSKSINFDLPDTRETSFTASPALGIEVNVTRNFKFSVEGGYKYVSKMQLQQLDNNQLNRAFGMLSLHFSVFDKETGSSKPTSGKLGW